MDIEIKRLWRGYMKPDAAQACCMLSVDKVKQGLLVLIAPTVSNVKLRCTVEGGKAMAYVHIRPLHSTKSNFRDFTRSVTLGYGATSADGVTTKILKRIKGTKMTAVDMVAEQVLSVINMDDQLTACLHAAQREYVKIRDEYVKDAPQRNACKVNQCAESLDITTDRLLRFSKQLIKDADSPSAREETLRTINVSVKALMAEVDKLRGALAEFK